MTVVISLFQAIIREIWKMEDGPLGKKPFCPIRIKYVPVKFRKSIKLK